MVMRSRVVVAGWLLLCAACGQRASEAAARQPDTAGARDSIAGVAAATMTESSVLGLLAMSHAADSAAGALGAANGSSQSIKDFGRMVTREHHALRKDAEDVARGLRLDITTPQVPPDAPPDALRASLAKIPPGPAWDRAYLSYTVALHQSAMENNARALAATRSPAIRRYITAAVPILQKHLDKARALLRAAAKTPPPDQKSR